MRSNFRDSGLKFTLILSLLIGSVGWLSSSAHGQQRPIRHEFIRGDMPPGLAAAHSKIANRSLVGHMQPVQLVTPKGCLVEIGGNGQFASAAASKVTLGMMIGPVYRFRVSNLPFPEKSTALYPSIEVINRLNPPRGLEMEFPIQVVISEDDLRQALEGRMVTKVVYLEDPMGTLPHKHAKDKQPSFDVGGGEDPLRAAEKLGRPMAILRMGSRVPMANDPNDLFDFGAPAPQVLPAPQAGTKFDNGYLKQLKEQGYPRRLPATTPVAQASPRTDRKSVRNLPADAPLSQDRVALAARAQYEAAVAEEAKANVVRQADVRQTEVRQTAATEEVKRKHPLPAPIIQSDVLPRTPRRPDQLNQF